MEARFFSLVFAGVWLCVVSFTSGMSINEYFPDVERRLSKVTFAHAVNSQAKLQEALSDDGIMMLEADIVMSEMNDQPIMAHPPEKNSDLSYSQFLEAVFRAVRDEGKRKGIKLDFKEEAAVEPCLKVLKARLDAPGAPKFPVFLNADILEGPVNSTRTPVNSRLFITLSKQYLPSATLSVGWTTRYGSDDPAEEIRTGKYTRQQVKEMVKLIHTYGGDPVVFPHVTFPVRAGLAAQSPDDMLYLLSRVRADSSITLWSANTDPVDRTSLRHLIEQATDRHVFIDLPFSLDAVDNGESNDLGETDPVEGDPDPQLLETRGQSEEETPAESRASSSFLSMTTLATVLVVGFLASVFLVNRRH